MNPWMILAWIVTAGSVAGLVGVLVWTSFRSGTSRSETSRPETLRSQLRSAGSRYKESESSADRREAEPGEHDAADFSFARYHLMERLLRSDDLRFLCSQTGFSARERARWKRDSLRIFRLYLNELTHDF